MSFVSIPKFKQREYNYEATSKLKNKKISAMQTSSMRITKEEEFMCGNTTIHLNKGSWHVT